MCKESLQLLAAYSTPVQGGTSGKPLLFDINGLHYGTAISHTAGSGTFTINQPGVYACLLYTSYTKLTGDVRFFDVDFAYEEGKTVLHNITLYAEPGQKVAFVGSTGAGKTTITNLILSLIHIYIMKNAGENAIFLHCLPAFHDLKTQIGREMGERFGIEDMEVTDQVFESSQSKVFDEAENRMHTIKAVMAATLGGI